MRDRSPYTRTQVISLERPTATSWSNGSCNGPPALFKTIWTRYRSFGKLGVSDDLSESDRSIDEKKFGFCDERSSRTFYKQNGKRNSTALQLLGENSYVATENDVSKSRELNVGQLLSSKFKSIPIGCTEVTEHKGRNFSCRSVGSSFYLLIMMIDDLTTLQEEQIQNRIMERSENELILTYLPRSQSTLMTKCVAKQILGNWLEIFLTYLEIYCFDVEVIMEVELNEPKHFGNVLFEGSKEKQLIELKECQLLILMFVIIGKIATSSEKTAFGNSMLLCEHVENNLFINELDYGQRKHCSMEEHSEQLTKMTMKLDISESQRRLMAD